MLESANVERNRSNSAFTASVKQSDRIKITLLAEPQCVFEFPVNVSFESSMVWVELADGRIIGAPIKWFPKLREADRLVRDQYQMTPVSLIWRTLNTQIHMDDLFDGDNNALYLIDDIDKKLICNLYQKALLGTIHSLFMLVTINIKNCCLDTGCCF